MTETAGLLAGAGGQRGYQYQYSSATMTGRQSKRNSIHAMAAGTGTGTGMDSAIPGPRSAGAGAVGGAQGLLRVSSVRRSVTSGHYTLSATGRPGATRTASAATTPTTTTTSTTTHATPATPATSAALSIAKTRLPVSAPPATAPESLPHIASPLHRQPRSYLRTRASSSLASSASASVINPVINPVTTSVASHAAAAPSRADDSAVSPKSSPPPHSEPSSLSSSLSSPPSSNSLGHTQPPPPPSFADQDKPALSANSLRRRHRSSSVDLPLAARPRPRAYSDQGPRPNILFSPPSQTFYLRRSSDPEPPVGRHSHSLYASYRRSSSQSLSSRSHREPASFSSQGISTSSGPPPSINARLLHLAAASDDNDDDKFAALQQRRRQQHQHHQRFISGSRQLLPLKTATTSSSPPDETRRRSAQHSYRLSLTGSLPANATPTRVPPIRSFRSSGSRKSLTLLDMNSAHSAHSSHDPNDTTGTGAPLYDDDTIRTADFASAADARFDRHARLMTPPVSGRMATPSSADETGDVFLRLAREEAMNRTGVRTPDGSYSPVSATHRSWHRRPLSTNVVASSYQPLSPPKQRRRLSDQQDRPFLGNLDDDNTSQTARLLQYRSITPSKAASAHPGEASSQFGLGSRTHRPPPVSSRSPSVYHENSDNYRHTRRRSSVTESTPPISGRPQSHKAGAVYNYSKTFHSSPLVRSFDLPPPQNQDIQNGVEGTESTASTTAPSTVWDELDELKSRINRLELTGKLPSTSGAAVTKLSEERPATANTTVTTASISPKRQVHVHTDETGSTPTSRDAYSILQNALATCKQNLSPEVYRALDCLAQDAMGLSTAMGHGPIPSGASTIGTGSAATDRQLRRKAESVCRSLGELCITLNDATYKAAASQQQAPAYAAVTPSTPTLPKSHSGGLPVSRRASVVESNIPLAAHTSPRVMSRLEERRNSLLHSANGPPVSLHAPNHAPASDLGLNRHSSLFVSRTRQPRAEEPEDGRESSLLRNRRAMTEEPEESGRKSSFLIRNRRGTGDDMSLPLSRSPTRRNHEYFYDSYEHNTEQDAPDRQDTASVVSSVAASRRRMLPELHTSRLAQPALSSPAPTRKYLDRSVSVSTRDGAGTPTTLERLSRNFSLHSRIGTTQQHRSNRDSMIPRPPSGHGASDSSQ